MLTILLYWCLHLIPVDGEITTAIHALFAVKQEAVHSKDMRAYMKTIYTDQHYQQEQKHWFLDAVSFVDPNSFQIRVDQITSLGSNNYLVKITQSYTKNKQRYHFSYPVKVRKTTFGMKDTDTFLYEVKQGIVKVKYSNVNGAQGATHALSLLGDISTKLGNIYHWKPNIMEVKLYQNPELFRQSVKLSLPKWAGGWNEAKQAIKLVVGEEDHKYLYHGLAHEYTHQLVSSLTNDNAAYWLQEGAAMYYEAKLSGEPPQIDDHFQAFTIKELEKLNLEQLPDKIAGRYYLSCYEQFRQMVTHYGEAKIGQLFLRLSRYPFIDKDSAMKQKETNIRTSNSLRNMRMLLEYQVEERRIS